MNYLSVCSGIEAATVAWHPLGWNPIGFSEIEKFPCSVLSHRYPNVNNYGDMTKFNEWSLNEQPNLLVGGTPCQSFSVAGLRKGLDDPRGNLMLTYLAITAKFKPKWVVWENVPGVLSSNKGRDFGTFIGALGQIGYGFSYRVLDAQYVRTHGYIRAVPQRRRRVFVVGHLGDWRRAAAVLFNSESLRGNPPPGRKTQSGVTNSIEANPVAKCLTVKSAGALNLDYETADFVVALAGNIIGRKPENGGNGIGYDDTGSSYTLTKTDIHGVAYRTNAAGSVMEQDGVAACINTFTDPTAQFIQQQMRVRRLTPLECERLQGFPDGYTDIPGASDSARYKALGNSMAVNVMQLIGERITMVEQCK